MLRSLVIVGLLGLACCAAPASEEETAGGSDAVTVGSSWRSSIKEGYYEDGHAMLYVSSSLSRQSINLALFSGSGKLLQCSTAIDIPVVGEHAHEMLANDEERGCTLSLTTSGDSVRIGGTIDYQSSHTDVALTLAPQKDNAVVGSYADPFTDTKLTVSASSLKSVSIELVSPSGEVIAPMQVAAHEGVYDWYNFNVDAECPLIVSFGFGSDGKRNAFIMHGVSAKNAKCPPGLPMLLDQ